MFPFFHWPLFDLLWRWPTMAQLSRITVRTEKTWIYTVHELDRVNEAGQEIRLFSNLDFRSIISNCCSLLVFPRKRGTNSNLLIFLSQYLNSKNKRASELAFANSTWYGNICRRRRCFFFGKNFDIPFCNDCFQGTCKIFYTYVFVEPKKIRS